MTSAHSIAWNAYPALLAFGCFAAGIAVAYWMQPPAAFWVVSACAVGAAALWCLTSTSSRVVGRTDFVLTTSAFLLVAASGGLRQTLYTTLPPNHVAHVGIGREIDVFGWIIDAPTRTGSSARFLLRLDGRAGSRAGLLHVTVRNPAEAFSTCDVVHVRGDLDELPRARNPGDFDYGEYLRRKRVHLRIFASEASVVARRTSGITCVAADGRSAIEARLDRYLSDPQARGVLRALLLGDRRAIDRSVRDQFARTGLLHVLAVSGLHVMVVGMILYRLLRPSLMRLGLAWKTVEIIRTVVTAAILLAYMVLAGGSASVVRAVVMALLFMSAAATQRGTDSMNTLGAAALVILSVRPVHLFEPGFQLSMAAVGAIIAVTPQIQRWMPAPTAKPAHYVHSSVTVTIAATLGTLPVLVFHFGQAALGGLLLNLAAIPITTGVLVSGIAALAAGEFGPTIGVTIGASTDVLSRMLIGVAEWGDRYVGWSLIEWSIDHPAPIVSVTLIVLAVARWPAPHHRWPLLLGALAVITVHVWTDVVERKWLPSLQVVFLDVGQGDAAIVMLPGKEAMLVDAGPRSTYGDAGTDVILPQLDRLGIRRLHTVVITHPDSDHLGGLPAILRAVPVGRVIRSGFVHSSELYAETDHLLDSLRIPERAVRAGDTLDIQPNMRAYVLYPRPGLPHASPNDHSVVIRLMYGSTSILLAGDAPAAAELEIMGHYGELPSEVLKVGHHGSRTSSSPAFLSNVMEPPESMAIVSVALKNRYGLPDEDVIGRLERTGFDVRQTSETGAVWIRSDGRRIEDVPY